MSDRVRMTATSVFHNPLIETHLAEAEVRAQAHTVQEGDEFSTSELHASELERAGLAERSKGKAAPASDHAQRVAGFQTSTVEGLAGLRAAPAPANKMQPPARNKAPAEPVTPGAVDAAAAEAAAMTVPPPAGEPAPGGQD